MKKTKTQNQEILEYMQRGNAITPIEALDLFGCFRLGARIYDLREKGHQIEGRIIARNGKRYAQYRIMETK